MTFHFFLATVTYLVPTILVVIALASEDSRIFENFSEKVGRLANYLPLFWMANCGWLFSMTQVNWAILLFIPAAFMLAYFVVGELYVGIIEDVKKAFKFIRPLFVRNESEADEFLDLESLPEEFSLKLKDISKEKIKRYEE